MAKSQDTPQDVDKRALYGWWFKHSAWRDDLDKRMAHKALDIPETEDMQNVGNRNGMTWRELLAIGALLLAGGGMYQYFNHETHQAAPATAPVPSGGPADSEYEIRFYDADGRLVPVPHITQRPNT